jgi:hypothetical protein
VYIYIYGVKVIAKPFLFIFCAHLPYLERSPMLLVQFLFTPKVAIETGKTVKIVKCDSFGFNTTDRLYRCYKEDTPTVDIPVDIVSSVGVYEE